MSSKFREIQAPRIRVLLSHAASRLLAESNTETRARRPLPADAEAVHANINGRRAGTGILERVVILHSLHFYCNFPFRMRRTPAQAVRVAPQPTLEDRTLSARQRNSRRTAIRHEHHPAEFTSIARPGYIVVLLRRESRMRGRVTVMLRDTQGNAFFFRLPRNPNHIEGRSHCSSQGTVHSESLRPVAAKAGLFQVIEEPGILAKARQPPIERPRTPAGQPTQDTQQTRKIRPLPFVKHHTPNRKDALPSKFSKPDKTSRDNR